jgi:hypothetical protein
LANKLYFQLIYAPNLGLLAVGGPQKYRIFLLGIYKRGIFLKGNLAEAEQRLRDLAAHMCAFGMNKLEQCPELGVGMKITRDVFDRFAISRLDPPIGDVFSGDLLIFLQRMEGVDIKQVGAGQKCSIFFGIPHPDSSRCSTWPYPRGIYPTSGKKSKIFLTNFDFK